MFEPTFAANILIVQGPGIPTDQRNAGGLIVKVEDRPEAIITLIGQLSHRRSALKMPPDESDLVFAPVRIGRQVTIQMCGERIDAIAAKLIGAKDFAQVGEAVQDLLTHCAAHMVAVRQ